MVLQLWTQAQLQALVFGMLGQQDAADNELLTAQHVQDALYAAEVQFARDCRTMRRTASLKAVDEQTEYVLPEDTVVVVDATWDDDTEPLFGTDEAHIALIDPGYRQETSSDPEYWYLTRRGRISFYSKTNAPDGDETISLDIYCHPFHIGGGITSITQSAPAATVTVVTNAAHNLRAGDSVTISGSDVSAANAAWTVVTVPSTTSFTFTNATITTTTTDCELYYTSGALPMIDSTDVPNLPLEYRQAIAFYAAWYSSQLYLQGFPDAEAGGEKALQQYTFMVSKYLRETAV